MHICRKQLDCHVVFRRSGLQNVRSIILRGNPGYRAKQSLGEGESKARVDETFQRNLVGESPTWAKP